MPNQWDENYTDKVLSPKMIRDLEDKELLEAQRIMQEQKELDESLKQEKPATTKERSRPELGTDEHKILSAMNPKYFVPTDGKFQQDIPYGMKPVRTKNDLAELMGTDSSLIEVIE